MKRGDVVGIEVRRIIQKRSYCIVFSKLTGVKMRASSIRIGAIREHVLSGAFQRNCPREWRWRNNEQRP